MKNTLKLLKVAFKSEVEPELILVTSKEKSVTDSFHFKATRYMTYNNWTADDAGMIIYNKDEKNPQENFIEIRFVNIKEVKSDDLFVKEKQYIVDLFQFNYSLKFLDQFNKNIKVDSKKAKILSFKIEQSFTKIFSLDQKKKETLHLVIENTLDDVYENILYNAAVHELLMQSLECTTPNPKTTYVYKFLEEDFSRTAVINSREILLKNIHTPLTIRELSRKVAINECYLKRGFKEIFGTTIFDYYQQQRMEHAKFLLVNKSSSVSEVAEKLGYTSISHFSAAFKKHTGKSPILLGK